MTYLRSLRLNKIERWTGQRSVARSSTTGDRARVRERPASVKSSHLPAMRPSWPETDETADIASYVPLRKCYPLADRILALSMGSTCRTEAEIPAMWHLCFGAT